MSNLKVQGNASGAGTQTLQSANTSSSVTATLPDLASNYSLGFFQTAVMINSNFRNDKSFHLASFAKKSKNFFGERIFSTVTFVKNSRILTELLPSQYGFFTLVRC